MLKSNRGIATFATLAALAGIGTGWGAHGLARAEESPAALAGTQLARFYDALSGKADLADVLGGAFQIMRTDGTRYDRDGYLARHPSYSSYKLSGIKAAVAGDVLTASYFAAVNGQVEDVGRNTGGDPRLAVFTKSAGQWKLQSIANLGLGLASNPEKEGRAAVEAWLGAVASGDAAKVKAVIAPEFQIVRADGPAYDAEGYLASTLPKFDSAPKIDALNVTGFGDYLIARYNVTGGTEKLGGRLTVFRKSGDAWLVVAHANFGAVTQQ